MYHFIYRTESSSGKFYIGRHSTQNLDDGYLGSGVWVSQVKDKEKLTRTILEFCDSFEELKSREKETIALYLDDDLNMNFNDNPVGFASGDLNPNKDPVRRAKISERLRSNNPMKRGHSEESRAKISQALSGERNPFFGKSHTEQAKKSIGEKNSQKVWTDEERSNLSEVRKKQWNGERPPHLVPPAAQSEEAKQKLRQSALERPRVKCPHCEKQVKPHTFSRWHGNNCKSKTDQGLD